MDREKILQSLTALDFMAVDLGLYLNTHPNDKEALEEYNKIITSANIVREKYESEYGPLCSFRSSDNNSDTWSWKNNPWPWEESFNFQLAVKECN